MSQIQEEIRQQKPFHSPAHKAAVSLLRTSNLLVRHYTAVVGRQDVTLQQYNVMRILRGAGPAGLPTLEIGERMVEQTPGITRLIDRLEKKNLVRRERSSADRRQVMVRITPDGLALLAQLDGPVDRADEEGMAILNSEQLAELQALLDQIRDGLHKILNGAAK